MAKSKVNFPAAVIGVAWYRAEQWEILRNVAVDRDKLEEMYAEWLADAERVVNQLQQQGLRVIKVDVEVSDLMLGCESQRIPLDSKARSNYTTFKVQQLDKQKCLPQGRPTQPLQDAARRAPDGWDCVRFLEMVLNYGSFPFPNRFLPSRTPKGYNASRWVVTFEPKSVNNRYRHIMIKRKGFPCHHYLQSSYVSIH